MVERATAVVLDPSRYRPFPEVAAVLAELRAARVPVGIVSNFDDFLFEILRETGLDAQFPVVVTSYREGVCKPDPTIFQPALDALGSDRAVSYFVGDSVHSDMGGAKRAGLHGVLVDREGVHEGYRGTRIGSLLELTALLGL